MINKIDSLSGVQGQYKVNFRSNEPVTNPNQNEIKQDVSLAGTEALAVYNAPLLKHPEKLDVEPIKPAEINFSDLDSIEGEKIYTSEGKLHSIVNEDENNRTLIKRSEDNENLYSISTTDKKSGNVIKEELRFLKDGKDDEIYITEYSPETKKEVADTNYIDGVLSSASKTVTKPNGDVVVVRKSFKYNDYSVTKYSDKHDKYISVSFDKNKQLKQISKEKEEKLKRQSFEISFYNGGMISVDKHEEITIPNNFGVEKLNDINLVPSEKYNLDFDAKGLDGEKTYFSNGAIETNSFERNGEKIKAYFEPDGRLAKLELSNKVIKFSDDAQKVQEKLDDGKTKTTTLYDDGDKNVRFEDGNVYKEVRFSKFGKPTSYHEGVINSDCEDENDLALYFNKLGMLEFTY